MGAIGKWERGTGQNDLPFATALDRDTLNIHRRGGGEAIAAMPALWTLLQGFEQPEALGFCGM